MCIPVIQRAAFALGLSSLLLVAFLTWAQNTRSVSLAWNASTSPGVIDYQVVYGTSSSNLNQFVDAHTNLTVTIPNLSDSQTYFFAAIDTAATATSGLCNMVVLLRQQGVPVEQGLLRCRV